MCKKISITLLPIFIVLLLLMLSGCRQKIPVDVKENIKNFYTNQCDIVLSQYEITAVYSIKTNSDKCIIDVIINDFSQEELGKQFLVVRDIKECESVLREKVYSEFNLLSKAEGGYEFFIQILDADANKFGIDTLRDNIFTKNSEKIVDLESLIIVYTTAAKTSEEDKNYEEALKSYEMVKMLSDVNEFDYKIEFINAILNPDIYLQPIIEAKRYEDALAIINKTINFNDIDNYIPLCKYNIAISEYNLGRFTYAKVLFSEIPDYEESNFFIEKIDTLLLFQGTWVRTDNNYIKRIFSGWEYAVVIDSPDVGRMVFIFNFSLSDNVLKNMDHTFSINDAGILIDNDQFFGSIETYKKQSSLTAIPEQKLKKSPEIGMTKQEVLDSIWGEPKDINTTTTKYGTTEQWVYLGYKYIYFDDGVVSAIQD